MTTADNTIKRTARKPTARESFQLGELVREGYSESGLTDIAFAALASEKLGFPVSPSSVGTARNIFGLPSNRDVARALKTQEPIDLTQVLNELHALQQMIVALQRRIDTYFNA